jgi:short-subunit dehydrogenase
MNLRYHRFQNHTALITGSSSGLGAEFARQLGPHVNSVVLVARRFQRLEALKSELLSSSPNLTVHLITADLSSPQAVDTHIIPFLREHQITPKILINNAGLGDYGTFATTTPRRLLEQHHVNTTALTLLTHALLPSMLESRCGYILNVGSIAGYMPLPTFATYAATKAYVNSLTLALRAELLQYNVHVTLFAPGPIPTEFRATAQRPGAPPDAGRAPDWLTQPLPQSIQKALIALHDNHPVCTPGVLTRMIAFLMRHAPHSFTQMIFRVGLPKTEIKA